MAEVVGPIDGAVVFARGAGRTRPRPTSSAGLDVYRDRGCDGLVGLGGGSPIDAAKAIRLLATHPGSLADYDLTRGGLDRITADLPPMAAVPTTAGTGSEAGRGALIQLPQTGRKSIVLSPYLLAECRDLRPRVDHGPPPRPDRRRPGWTRSRTASRATSRRPCTRSATASRWRACGTSRGAWRRRYAGRRNAEAPAGVDDGGVARRDQLSQGAGRGPFAARTRSGRRGGSTTGRSTRSCCRTPSGSTARRRPPGSPGRPGRAARPGPGRRRPRAPDHVDRALADAPPLAATARGGGGPPPRPDRRLRPARDARPLPPDQPTPLHAGRHSKTLLDRAW